MLDYCTFLCILYDTNQASLLFPTHLLPQLYSDYVNTTTFKEGMAQLETIQEFVRHSEANTPKKEKTSEAWQYLQDHPECRLALFYLPTGHTPVPTVEEVLDFYCGVLSKRPLFRDQITGHFVSYTPTSTMTPE